MSVPISELTLIPNISFLDAIVNLAQIGTFLTKVLLIEIASSWCEGMRTGFGVLYLIMTSNFFLLHRSCS